MPAPMPRVFFRRTREARLLTTLAVANYRSLRDLVVPKP
jgi:hypothetical protein